jgi:hypothetical protein
MVLSPELLEKARAAGARLEEAERRSLLTRGDYHAAVRRLHLAGASLREIAEALSLSHQRVQQIVNGAGGTWWRRVWRTRRMPADASCTWCGRPPSEVEKLIAGPNVYICNACVEAAEKTSRAGAKAAPFTGTTKRSVAQRCAFCGKRATASRSLVTSTAGHVCSDCLHVCREILDGSR